jgi:DNA repair exonuclease SbcCD ATPase subunit
MDLKSKVKEEEQTLDNLQSGKITTCTNCGTELTPELRKSNETRLLDEINGLKFKIEKLSQDLESFEKEMKDSSFKNKLHILKTNNLTIEIPERLNDFLLSFKKFLNSSGKLEELEEEKTELNSKLPEKWKSFLDKSKIDKTSEHLKSINQVYSSYLSDLVQLKESLSEKRQKINEIRGLEKQFGEVYSKFELDQNQPYEKLKEELEDLKDMKITKEESIDNLNIFQDLKEKVDQVEAEIRRLEKEKKVKQNELENPPYNTLENDKSGLENDRTKTNDRRREISSELATKQHELEEAEAAGEEKKVKENRVRKLTKFEALATSVSTVFRELRPKILNYKTKRIVDRTNDIIRDMPSQADTLRLGVEEIGEEYNLIVFRNGKKGKLHTVSGGELTGLGFALRVAIAQDLSNLGILILDEPTYGLDRSRRSKLAEILVSQDYIKQLLVVTHDEIFKGKTEKITQIRQNNGVSRNMAEELGIQMVDLD